MLIATVNVNGLRSSLRKGFADWLAVRNPDVVCLQEIRVFPEKFENWPSQDDWHANWLPAERPGYAGVAILSRQKPKRVEKFGQKIYDTEGRWLMASFGKIDVASLYLPSGSHDQDRQKVKLRCMRLLAKKMGTLSDSGRHTVVAGDYNIAHNEIDLKNWRANQKNSGFLPEERMWLTNQLGKGGWVDVYRRLHPGKEAYSWWSQRSGARDRNVGWRIDYQLATAKLAAKARSAGIDCEPRISDHAPVWIDYGI